MLPVSTPLKQPSTFLLWTLWASDLFGLTNMLHLLASNYLHGHFFLPQDLEVLTTQCYNRFTIYWQQSIKNPKRRNWVRQKSNLKLPSGMGESQFYKSGTESNRTEKKRLILSLPMCSPAIKSHRLQHSSALPKSYSNSQDTIREAKKITTQMAGH